MFEDDRSYFQHRADVEAVRARKPAEPAMARVHAQLAAAYFGKRAAVGPAIAEAA